MNKSRSTLILKKIDVAKNRLNFTYSLNGAIFSRGLVLPESTNLSLYTSDPIYEKLLHYCALADCVYMFNFDYFDYIDVPFKLSKNEKDLFENIYFMGLAEFRYQNSIDIHKKTLINDQTTGTANPINPIKAIKHDKRKASAFVLNGGGKDGAVAMEIASTLGIDLEWLSVGSAQPREAIRKASNQSQYYMVHRRKSQSVEIKQRYSGHKPMSFYVAMVASLAAYIEGKSYVISANEYSASFPNLSLHNVMINHQYSKSLEFENDLTKLFMHNNIPVRYFSITRRLYDLQVMKLFSNFDHYHSAFNSCNRGIYDNFWCLACAKCAFTVGAFYCFATDKAQNKWGDMTTLYGNNVYLTNETIELVNPNQKPFECIGTLSENRWLAERILTKTPLSPTQTSRYTEYMDKGSNCDEVFDIDYLPETNNYPTEFSKQINLIIKELL